MRTTTELPAATVEESLAAERRAFERRRAQLMRRYPGEYVALYRGRVVGHDRDDEVLAARMFKKLGEAPFYVARLERTQTLHELPSPEMAG